MFIDVLGFAVLRRPSRYNSSEDQRDSCRHHQTLEMTFEQSYKCLFGVVIGAGRGKNRVAP